PDWIVYPTGGGTGMVGMWKAFDEIERIGWIDPGRRPRMVSVQAENCAPIVRAFQLGAEKAQPWEAASTLADGLRVPRAIGDFLILRAIRESGGTALSVSDPSMVDGMLAIGAYEGVSAAPEGGAAFVAIQRLAADGSIRPDDSVVLFNTGGGIPHRCAFSTTPGSVSKRDAEGLPGQQDIEIHRHGLRLPDDFVQPPRDDVGWSIRDHRAEFAPLQELDGLAPESCREDAIE